METPQVTIEILDAPRQILCATCGHVIPQDLHFDTAKTRGFWLYHHVNRDCAENQKMFKIPFITRLVSAI